MQQTKPKPKTRLRISLKKEAKVVKKEIVGVPIKIYDHISGDRFSHRHKMRCGLTLMVFGVLFSQLLSRTGYHLITFVGDGFGYFIHGAGCTPFLEYLHCIVIRRNDSRKQ